MKGAKTDGTGWDGMGWSGAFFNDFDDDDVLVYWYNPVYFLLSFLLIYSPLTLVVLRRGWLNGVADLSSHSSLPFSYLSYSLLSLSCLDVTQRREPDAQWKGEGDGNAV